MTDRDRLEVERAIGSLQHRLNKATDERDRLTREIVRLENNIRNLEVLLVKDAIDEGYRKFTAIGVTEAIKTVMRTHGQPMTATDVRLGLRVMGFDLSTFRNPSAAVHNTLKRLHKQREIAFGVNKEGKAVYSLKRV